MGFLFFTAGGVSLNEALKSRNVIMGGGNFAYPYPSLGKGFFDNEDGILDYWRRICKKYIRVNPIVEERRKQAMLMFHGKKILGVMCRGTDYVTIRPKDHPIQPSVQMVMGKVDQTMVDHNFDALYLVTEDREIVSAFQKNMEINCFCLSRII